MADTLPGVGLLSAEAIERRAMLIALRDNAAATRELRDVVGRLCDKIDRLGGNEPDQPAERFHSNGAMGGNGR